MESTNIYWIPIWCVLEEMFYQKLVNTYFIKQLPRRKTDVKNVELSNIRISNHISNANSESYHIAAKTISQGVTKSEELISHITLNKHSRDTMLATLTGIVTEINTDIIGMMLEEIETLHAYKNKCQEKMFLLCKKHYPKQLERLHKIPGVKKKKCNIHKCEGWCLHEDVYYCIYIGLMIWVKPQE